MTKQLLLSTILKWSLWWFVFVRLGWQILILLTCIGSTTTLKLKHLIDKTKHSGGLPFYAREDVNYTATKFKSNIEHVIVTIHRDALGQLNVCFIIRRPDAKAVIFNELDCLLTDLSEKKGDSILVWGFKIDVLENLEWKINKLELFWKILDFLCRMKCQHERRCRLRIALISACQLGKRKLKLSNTKSVITTFWDFPFNMTQSFASTIISIDFATHPASKESSSEVFYLHWSRTT